MKIKVRGRRRNMKGDGERWCRTESDKDKKEMREKNVLLSWSDVLLTIHYPPFIIYTFHTHSGEAALTFLTRTVCE